MIPTSQLETINNRIRAAIKRRQLSYALEQLDSMAQSASAPWTVKKEVDALRESYSFLRRYALDNVEDPERETMFNNLLSSVARISESIVRLSLVPDSPKQYFSVLRYEQMQPDSSLPQLLKQLEDTADRLSLASLSSNPYSESPEIKRLNGDCDRISRRTFDYIWVSYPLTVDDEKALISFLSNDRIRIELREHLLSAVMLGGMEYYDERRMVILAKVYLSGIKRMEVKALVALVLSIWMQRGSLSGRSFCNIMAAVSERDTWKDDLKMVFLNLVRTRDTDRIARTMNEEVIPQMMKLRPEIFKKFKDLESIDDLSALEDNPDWENLLSNSGVADKLKELNELQSEGGDVMLSTFSSLKLFPFFHNVSNWFLPFYLEQSNVSAVLGESAADLGEMIDMAPLLCDSDKYSMVLSLDRLPAANRRMMLEQFRMQSVNVAELRNSMLNPEMQSRSNVANRYIQDLYRFFTLYRKKNEFRNPFASPINLAAVPLLSAYLNDNDALEAVAEFYFRRKYYAEAYNVFRLLLNDATAGSASMMQKAGYCCQQLGNPQQAYEWYKKSELLAPDSEWTVKRIAQTLRLLGRHAEAIPYYERLSKSTPEDVPLALNLGHCYLAVGDYNKALQSYYKAEYFDSKRNRALRPLAWCTFVEGDYEKSLKYYDRILADKPDDSDFLNAGHLAMAMKDYRRAASLYRRYLQAHNFDIAALDKALEADMAHLRNAAVDPLMLAIAVDAAQYPES